MNIKQIVRICLQLSIVMSLLIANTSIAAAGGGKGGDIIGKATNSVSNSFPIPTPKELEKWGFSPDAAKSLPSGGTASAVAMLEWSTITMYSTATSSLSSNTVGSYNTCARVIRLLMNGVSQGSHSNPQCNDLFGGGSITDSLNKTVASGVRGKTWKVDTYHDFVNNSTGYAWHTPLSVTANP